MSDAVILRHWRVRVSSWMQHSVLPDGCCDLIVRRRPGAPAVWFVSDLATGPDRVTLAPGDACDGFRLRPGVRIDRVGLLASMRDDLDDGEIRERLHHHVTPLANVAEALAALDMGGGQAGGVAGTAARLEVQERSLQRLLMRETGRSPVFWMRLARVRRAAARVAQAGSLAELAYDLGYADQAHMTREFRHWLGVTPRRIRLDAGWAGRHLVRGYGV